VTALIAFTLQKTYTSEFAFSI